MMVRTLLLSLALASLAPAAISQEALSAQASLARWTPKDGQKLVFDVFRDGGAFGTHIVTFTRTGERLTVQSDIALKVALGPLTLFDYRMNVTEIYDGDKLASVWARTFNEGKWTTMTAEPVAGGYKVKGPKFSGTVQNPIPSTHWNIAEMKQSAILSTETGEMLKTVFTDLGLEQVKLKSGAVSARKYHMDADLDADFWYDAEGRWVKTYFETKGSKISYTLRELPG